MHDIWNPWHGCTKISEGCLHCYMYYMDKRNNIDSSIVYKTKNFNYPLSKDRNGEYKIKSGELIRVCMTSDFCLEEADQWRHEVWRIIKKRSDVKFYILTKRAQRLKECLPDDWNDGYENVILNVTCENQARADQRIPILLNIPAKHKGVMCAPLIGRIDLSKYLSTGQIEQVVVGGENYDGSRPCHHEWVVQLYIQVKKYNIKFCFIETGNYYVKNHKTYYIPSKRKQAQLAYLSRLQNIGKPIHFHLEKQEYSLFDEWYIPYYREHCKQCGSRLICNGCSDCGRCQDKIVTKEEMDAYDSTINGMKNLEK